MKNKTTSSVESYVSPFEKIKHVSDQGSEYWSAREFAEVLEYTQYRNFEKVIEKAKLACFNSGYPMGDHFADVSKMVPLGSSAQREVAACGTICIAAAAHQAWSANLFTTVSDMFPKKAVGTVTGIGAMAGGLGGVVIQKLTGALTDAFARTPQTAYVLMFVVCSMSYLVAWGVIKLLVPRHTTITDL